MCLCFPCAWWSRRHTGLWLLQGDQWHIRCVVLLLVLCLGRLLFFILPGRRHEHHFVVLWGMGSGLRHGCLHVVVWCARACMLVCMFECVRLCVSVHACKYLGVHALVCACVYVCVHGSMCTLCSARVMRHVSHSNRKRKHTFTLNFLYRCGSLILINLCPSIFQNLYSCIKPDFNKNVKLDDTCDKPAGLIFVSVCLLCACAFPAGADQQRDPFSCCCARYKEGGSR